MPLKQPSTSVSTFSPYLTQNTSNLLQNHNMVTFLLIPIVHSGHKICLMQSMHAIDARPSHIHHLILVLTATYCGRKRSQQMLHSHFYFYFFVHTYVEHKGPTTTDPDMVDIVLVTHHLCPFAQRAHIALAASGLKYVTQVRCFHQIDTRYSHPFVSRLVPKLPGS